MEYERVNLSITYDILSLLWHNINNTQNNIYHSMTRVKGVSTRQKNTSQTTVID